MPLALLLLLLLFADANGVVSSGISSDCPAQADVVLGTAFDYVVLAGQSVTTGTATGTKPDSLMYGDAGIFPGSSFTGTGVVSGFKEVASAAAGIAIDDLRIAYNDARDRGYDRVSAAPAVGSKPIGHDARASCIVEISGNLAGWTLTPGLYRATSPIIIKDQHLTLDGDGVFIFQMSTTFETDLGDVILAGGASAEKIFWQVGTSAHIGLGTTVYGTIMADQSVTSGVGAKLHGRAFGRFASVTMLESKMARPDLAASQVGLPNAY
jgi:hypothetical protein